MEKHDHPNLLGASILCGLLSAIIAALSVAAFVTKGDMPDFTAATATIVLGGLSVAAFRAHRRLAVMTPEERDAWWQAFEARNKENHDRLVEAYVRRGKDGIG